MLIKKKFLEKIDLFAIEIFGKFFYNLEMEKTCTSCKLTKPYSEFVKHSYTNDGMSYTCKSCKKLKYLALKKRKLEGENFVTEKKCKKCHEIKPREDFTLCAASDGLFTYCKECYRKSQNEKYYTEEGRKSHRKSTNKYARKKYSIDDRYKTSINLARNFNLFLENSRKRKQWSKYENLIGYEVSNFINKIGNRPSTEHQIDHKIPTTWFSDECPFNVIWDMRNLWWVSKEYNNRKGNKWCDVIPEDYLEVVRPYLNRDLVFESEVNS
jgi:hypothetical protein